MDNVELKPFRDGSHNIGKMAELGDGSVLITGHRRKDGEDQYQVIDPYRFHRPARGELWLDAIELTKIMDVSEAIKDDDTPGHSPGPWTVVRKDYVATWYEVWSGKNRVAGEIKRKVDADMIASAPLMLRVLKSVAVVLGETRDYGSEAGELAADLGNSMEKVKMELWRVKI